VDQGETSLPNRVPRNNEVASCTPTAAVWELTLACNLGCKLCGSRAGKRRRDELTTEEALDLVRQMAAIGVRDVGLIGGEAHLREDWTEIAAAITRAGMECSIQTGGRGFSEAVARQASRAGVTGVGVSIDGLLDNHDLIRGLRGSFRHALDALRNARATGLATSVSTQLWSRSLADLPALLPIIADAGAKSWQIQLSVAMGRAADNEFFLLQPYQMLDAFEILSRLYDDARKNGIRLIIANNIGYFGPYEAKLRSVASSATHWDGCSAGRNSIGIEADGKIKGCPSLSSDTFTGANIRDVPLRKIFDSKHELNYIRSRSQSDLWGYCSTCYYAAVCLGGCTWTAHSLFARPGNNPYCHYRALTLSREGLFERVRRVKSAPGLPFDNGVFELILEDAEGTIVSKIEPPEERFSCDTGASRPVHTKLELLICTNCEQFVLPDETTCPHCSRRTVVTLKDYSDASDRLAESISYIRSSSPT
jgi:radical SAM protein with 4Fe4S-binding SPASM domain